MTSLLDLILRPDFGDQPNLRSKDCVPFWMRDPLPEPAKLPKPSVSLPPGSCDHSWNVIHTRTGYTDGGSVDLLCKRCSTVRSHRCPTCHSATGRMPYVGWLGCMSSECEWEST